MNLYQSCTSTSPYCPSAGDVFCYVWLGSIASCSLYCNRESGGGVGCVAYIVSTWNVFWNIEVMASLWKKKIVIIVMERPKRKHLSDTWFLYFNVVEFDAQIFSHKSHADKYYLTFFLSFLCLQIAPRPRKQ